MTQIIIPVTGQFDFQQTVLSHGWSMLAPFELDRETMTLAYTYQLKAGDVVQLLMHEGNQQIHVDFVGIDEISNATQREIIHVVKTIFNTQWNLASFYEAMQAFEGYDWLEKERKGRILIAPTLWEDLAKVLFTTNTTWAQTIQMSQRLCSLGQPHPTIVDTYAFPTAQTIANMKFETLANSIRAGYRTAYLYELAQFITNNTPDLENWRRLESDSLYQQVKSLKGYGDYAAGTIVRMLGHFDKLAIDSACREMYATLHNHGEKGTDKAIRAHYAQFGQWKGLVMWMDIMRR